jgi:nitrous oxidase accessory protein NosD
MAAVYAGLAAALILQPHAADAHALAKDAVWSGTVKVEGQLVVEKGVTLTVMPGARVLFLPGKLDEEGLAQSGLLVRGRVVARGGQKARITFTSGAAKPSPGDWGEIKLIESTGSEFTGCDFSFGGWGLHVHDSKLSISKCTFINNSYGGVRGVGGDVEVAGCTFRGMDIGIRYWKGAPSIHHNTITGNRTGIFLRQDTGSASIYFNNIYGNSEYDMKLGDAHKDDVDARRNWWGTREVSYIRKKIYDKDRDGYVGRVNIEPVLDRRVELP